ncbi:DUF1622 domain-containing protein [Christiangramia salexigens]|uniref:DUF1622 domain-containing protein n=1 Tax=Christiangramia salexigens TaxID=1913577 RepID=A0A1L3J1R6_9FLAO|nr:DUF1622 domain-containing protein [Christiangramia salexigens]APG59063.1 hypothetical protein LPB144_00970 [Christiangramia salexigens]
MERMEAYIDIAAKFLEASGVIAIIAGLLYALGRYFFIRNREHRYSLLRKEIGKAILLGLEILVAADIIATVVTEPSMQKVLTLGIIVLIRTFLSWSIELEIEGRFPWQKDTGK